MLPFEVCASSVPSKYTSLKAISALVVLRRASTPLTPSSSTSPLLVLTFNRSACTLESCAVPLLVVTVSSSAVTPSTTTLLFVVTALSVSPLTFENVILAFVVPALTFPVAEISSMTIFSLAVDTSMNPHPPSGIYNFMYCSSSLNRL